MGKYTWTSDTYTSNNGTIGNVWNSDNFDFDMSRMFYFDRKKNKNYLQFKYLGELNDLEDIKEDVKEYMLLLGMTAIEGVPAFRYYINSQEILDLLVTLDFDGINKMLRLMKIKILTGKCNNEEKSNYTFINFFMFSFEKKLIKDVSYNELY